MDLERELRVLRVDWPATPTFAFELRRRRRWLPFALAAALAAVAVAFAVPQSRGAILRFFDIGSVHVRVVDTLPPAQQKALTTGLGRPVSLGDAQRAFRALLLPPLDPLPELQLAPGNFVSVVFAYQGRPILLSEFDNGYYLKKLAAPGTTIEHVVVRGSEGLWLEGAAHVFFMNRSPRLAGNVLLWAENGATYRLEGPDLTKRAAIALAGSLRRG